MSGTGKSRLRKFICGAAIACASFGANATTTNLGAIPAQPTPFNVPFVPAGSFTDIFTFTLPANLGSGYSVFNFPLTIPGVGTFNTVLNTMALVRNPDGILFNGDDVFLETVMGNGVSFLSLTFGPTNAGSYFLRVEGLANGTLGGIYSGAISVTPVPEPEIWAMLLVGTGLVGFQLRRKSKAAEANQLTLA